MAKTTPSPATVEPPDVLHHVPVALRIAAAFSWRLIVIGIVVFFVLSVVATLGAIVVPFIIALLLAAPLGGAVNWLAVRGWPRALAALTVLLSLIVVVLGLVALASQQLISAAPKLRDQASEGLRTLVDWLADSPLHLSRDDLQAYLDSAGQTISENKTGLVASALSITSTVGLVVAGLIFALFCLFFFLKDGRILWLKTLRWFPHAARHRLDVAAQAGWGTLSRFTRTSVTVALIDATGIGLGAYFLGLKLVVPIAIIVFLTSFIPLVGASLSGSVAILVTLVEGGWVKALIIVGVVIVVQQVEGSVLYPWLFGRAASVHPIAILISISAGAILAGMVGALLAVPLMSFAKAFIGELRDDDDDPLLQPPAPPAPTRRRRVAKAA